MELSKEQNRVLAKNFQQAEALRAEKKTALQSRQMNSYLREILNKDNEEQKTKYYQQQLEETYARIDRLEKKEQNMLQSLQVTMKEHQSLVQHEKMGELNPELVDKSIQKFNLQSKQEFRYY